MDVQEKIMLVAARLKGSTYPGDKLEALKEARALAEEDSVVAGTHFLDPVIDLLQDTAFRHEDAVFQVLNKIFEGGSGEEFIDIAFKRENMADVCVEYLADAVFEEHTDLFKTVSLLSRAKPEEFSRAIMGSKNQELITEEISKGRTSVLSIVHSLVVESAALRKFLVFTGVMECTMNLALKTRERQAARKGLDLLSALVSSGEDMSAYFLDLSWKEWMHKLLKLHPHHAARLFYSVVCASGSSSCGLLFLAEFIGMQDLMGVYLILRHSKQAYALFTAESPELYEKYKGLLAQLKKNQCVALWNCVSGIEGTLQECSGESVPRHGLEDPLFFSSLAYTSPELTDVDVSMFLYKLEGFGEFSFFSMVFYLKSVIGLLLKDTCPAELFYSVEVLGLVTNFLDAEDIPKEVKPLLGFWLLMAFTGVPEKERSSTHFDIFKTFYSKHLSFAKEFVHSFLSPGIEASVCGTRACKRCYLTDISFLGRALPSACTAVLHLFYFPSVFVPRIIEAYSSYLYIHVALRKVSFASAGPSKPLEEDAGMAHASAMKEDKKSSPQHSFPSSVQRPSTDQLQDLSLEGNGNGDGDGDGEGEEEEEGEGNREGNVFDL
ncbi:hypothetical protein NECID01_1975 [Nematocida sp. AWRm77]|nr:hypothetical protein NECID01_1975 [Nematocida sp. AWRm77]